MSWRRFARPPDQPRPADAGRGYWFDREGVYGFGVADWSRMVHGIGDMHADGIKRPRVAAMLDDANRLSPATLEWLEARLKRAGRDCWIACHWPLHGTVILAINLSPIVYVGKKRQPEDPICSLYLTHLPGRIEIRLRNHRARRWKTVRGNRVQTVCV